MSKYLKGKLWYTAYTSLYMETCSLSLITQKQVLTPLSVRECQSQISKLGMMVVRGRSLFISSVCQSFAVHFC